CDADSFFTSTKNAILQNAQINGLPEVRKNRTHVNPGEEGIGDKSGRAIILDKSEAKLQV
ncbi:hypothetical protein, partial [Alicyclobacillus hesperidum]|uniref:hypothetical protein n=1 Tax=Alicyclobacillus hesperidum TaxID=89784 RepID=UPI001ED96C09